jgi:hypothetical protein
MRIRIILNEDEVKSACRAWLRARGHDLKVWSNREDADVADDFTLSDDGITYQVDLEPGV